MGGCFVLKTSAATVDALTHVLVEPCRAAFAHCVSAGDYRALPGGGVPCHQSRGGRWTHHDIPCDLSIVDGLGGLDVSVKGAQEGGASRGWVKQ